MADSKLSALPSGSAIADADLFYSDQGGNSVSQRADAILKYIAEGLTRGVAPGVNLNSVADTEIAIKLPPGVTTWIINGLYALNASIAAPSTTQVALYTGPGATGTTIVAPTALTMTSNTPGAAASAMLAAGGGTVFFNVTTVYLRVTTPQGAPATCDFILDARPGAS